MSWKEFAADWLNFTRKDRIGLLVIFSLMILVLLIPSFLHRAGTGKIQTDTSWIATLEKLEQKSSIDHADEEEEEENFLQPYYRKTNGDPNLSEGELFYFDPNTLPVNDWKRLGLRDKTIRTIQNYLQKGGRFRKPEDLQRIYGLSAEQYKRIESYIRISGMDVARNDFTFPEEFKPVKKESRTYSIIDINTADTTAFINLPGIGSKLAARIVSFRDKLGGFYSIEQVAETFGLADSTFQKIKPFLRLGTTGIKKIGINTITLDELKTHPYIRFSIASAIIAFRNEHGPFQKVEDIKKVMAVTEEIYKKCYPYLSILNE